MRKFEKHLREVCLLYYFDKAGYELMEQDDSIIGVGLEFYCKALNVAVILSRPFHETIHGRRIENAKNDLCRKNNIRLIRILEAGCRTYDNCMCLQCDDESLQMVDFDTLPKNKEKNPLGNEVKITDKKYVRYKEGAERYSMGLHTFQELAKEANEIYRVRKIVLVNTEIFEEFLETFKEDQWK